MRYQAQTGKVVACLVARLKSTRLPRKAVADICGKPMTLRIIERLRQAHTIDEIVVCTSTHPDDRELLDLADEWGVSSFAGDPDDVLSRLISVADARTASIVLRITGDNVFTCPETIDNMVSRHISSGAEYSRTNNLPLGVTAEVLSTGMLQPLYDAMPDPNQSEYMMLYAFDPERFRCMVHSAPENCHRPHYALSVDTLSDLVLAQRLFKAYQGEPYGPSISQVVAMLDADPGYHGVPDDALIRMPGGISVTFGALLRLLDDRARRAHELYGMP